MSHGGFVVNGESSLVIPPGGVIGILGGGQLGRMTIEAAQVLGWRCHVFCPEADSPAGQVADRVHIASYEDEEALAGFAEAVDIITYEFENIPLKSIDFLARHCPIRPGRQALEIAQNRIREKAFLNAIASVSTVPYRPIRTKEELTPAIEVLGCPAILKSALYGYDGKGQVRIDHARQCLGAWQTMPDDGAAVLEAFIDYEKEISVIVARGEDGTMRVFDPAENSHVDHILDISRVPASLSPQLTRQAETIACDIAAHLSLVGVLAVEMFLTRQGELMVNEIAPRPHNSGHWTLDACETSQFCQFVCAITGSPLRDPARHQDVDMKNLIGKDVARRQSLSLPGDSIHLYGKKEVRPGRKMGHINRVRPMGAPAIPFAAAHSSHQGAEQAIEQATE